MLGRGGRLHAETQGLVTRHPTHQYPRQGLVHPGLFDYPGIDPLKCRPSVLSLPLSQPPVSAFVIAFGIPLCHTRRCNVLLLDRSLVPAVFVKCSRW